MAQATLRVRLASVQSTTDNAETCSMVIHRSMILKSTLSAVNRPSFSYQCRIVVESLRVKKHMTMEDHGENICGIEIKVF